MNSFVCTLEMHRSRGFLKPSSVLIVTHGAATIAAFAHHTVVSTIKIKPEWAFVNAQLLIEFILLPTVNARWMELIRDDYAPNSEPNYRR